MFTFRLEEHNVPHLECPGLDSLLTVCVCLEALKDSNDSSLKQVSLTDENA